MRQSWDRYLERTGGANWSGPATKLLYGPDSLRENNYIRFDKQTNREDFKRKDIPKVHPARFLYIPESDFSSPNRRQYNIDFEKQKPRNEGKKYFGVDLEKIRERILTEEE